MIAPADEARLQERLDRVSADLRVSINGPSALEHP